MFSDRYFYGCNYGTPEGLVTGFGYDINSSAIWCDYGGFGTGFDRYYDLITLGIDKLIYMDF